jgi:hypothetical protein
VFLVTLTPRRAANRNVAGAAASQTANNIYAQNDRTELLAYWRFKKNFDELTV